MRWDNLRAEEEDRRRLPGYRDAAVVRSFDAPEALGTRFYEVRARSALNRVPAKSSMPFRWTINPYRGCTHACTYCLAGDTPVLMADGRTKAIADLRAGDRVYGTARDGACRRYVTTAVLDHWVTYETAYRVALEDGTELVASADHRFLTRRGWKHVAGAGRSLGRRPRLSLADELVGTGHVAPAHDGADDYRRGHLCGMVRGGSHGVGDVRDPPGGARERLRLVHATDPAVTPKRSIEGAAVEPGAYLRVVSIEPLRARRPLFDITTGTGDFIASGVVSHNCFARPTHTYLDFNAREDFEREIVVKVNAPELVRAEVARPTWAREHVAMGTNTDPYQWVEGRYRLMPGIWEALGESGTPCSILTKSPLVLRDLPLLRRVSERASVAANLSVPTLDERTWRATEPRTPNPRARLEAVRELNRAGIPTGILIAPLMPGVNDDPRQVEAIVELAADAGAVSIHGLALHLRGEVREIFLDWLEAKRPDLVPRYEELYRRGAYAPVAERRRLAALVRRAGPAPMPRPDPAPADATEDPGDGLYRRPDRRRRRGPPRGSAPQAGKEVTPTAVQPSLF